MTSADCDALVEAGVQHLILGVGGDGSGYDLGRLRELVQWRDARLRADLTSARPGAPSRARPRQGEGHAGSAHGGITADLRPWAAARQLTYAGEADLLGIAFHADREQGNVCFGKLPDGQLGAVAHELSATSGSARPVAGARPVSDPGGRPRAGGPGAARRFRLHSWALRHRPPGRRRYDAAALGGRAAGHDARRRADRGAHGQVLGGGLGAALAPTAGSRAHATSTGR